MRSIFYSVVFCLLLSVSARRDLRQTEATSFSSTSTPGTTAFASASATSSSTSTSTSSSSSTSTTDGDTSSDPLQYVDVYFLVDVTVTTPGALDELQENARGIVEGISNISSRLRIGLAEYEDLESQFGFTKLVDLTHDTEAVIRGLNGLVFAVGHVEEESQFFALEAVATDDEIGFRDDAVKVVVWIGDSPGMDPTVQSTEETAIAALINAGMVVVAIDTEALDRTGQATRIATETDGLLLRRNENGLFETVALSASSDSGSTASTFASGDFTFLSTSIDGSTATVVGPLPLPDAIVESVDAAIDTAS